MSIKSSKHQRYLVVAGEMTVYRAPKLKEQLLAAARDRRGEARIDLSRVTEVDTAGLQLLLMLRRLANAAGARFALINPGPGATEVLELCGLGNYIEASNTEVSDGDG